MKEKEGKQRCRTDLASSILASSECTFFFSFRLRLPPLLSFVFCSLSTALLCWIDV